MGLTTIQKVYIIAPFIMLLIVIGLYIVMQDNSVTIDKRVKEEKVIVKQEAKQEQLLTQEELLTIPIEEMTKIMVSIMLIAVTSSILLNVFGKTISRKIKRRFR